MFENDVVSVLSDCVKIILSVRMDTHTQMLDHVGTVNVLLENGELLVRYPGNSLVQVNPAAAKKVGSHRVPTSVAQVHFKPNWGGSFICKQPYEITSYCKVVPILVHVMDHRVLSLVGLCLIQGSSPKKFLLSWVLLDCTCLSFLLCCLNDGFFHT